MSPSASRSALPDFEAASAKAVGSTSAATSSATASAISACRPGFSGDRLEAASPARGDALQRDAPQQVRRHLPRQRPPGGVQARVLRQRRNIEVERDAALRDQAAAELIAVPRRRHEHERGGEAVVLVAPRGAIDEPPGLAGPRGPVRHHQLAHHRRL